MWSSHWYLTHDQPNTLQVYGELSVAMMADYAVSLADDYHVTLDNELLDKPLMTAQLDITIKRGDTRRHTFVLTDSSGTTVDVSGWSLFSMAVTSERDPIDTSSQLGIILGYLSTDGTDGRISFTPPGNWAIGKYFYDAQAFDANGEKITFSEGKYIIDQDRDKS